MAKDQGKTDTAGLWLTRMASGDRNRPGRSNNRRRSIRCGRPPCPSTAASSPVARQVEKICAFRLEELRAEVEPSDAPEAAAGPLPELPLPF